MAIPNLVRLPVSANGARVSGALAAGLAADGASAEPALLAGAAPDDNAGPRPRAIARTRRPGNASDELQLWRSHEL